MTITARRWEFKVYKLFLNTLGKIVRTFQSMLTSTPEKTMLDYMLQNSLEESATFAERNMPEAIIFETRENLFKYLVSNFEINDDLKIIAEFGVFEGESINLISRLCPKSTIFGFDSFEGLQENMGGYRLIKGHFDLGGNLPKVEKNVKLIKGWYKDTVESFVTDLGQKSIALLHLDSDTYESTKFILENLSKLLTPGSILVFDEFFGIIGWKNHEFKAWSEFSKNTNVKYKYVAFTNVQVAIQIL